MQASRDIARLVEIMAALRHPDTGCPWDIEQNFQTIAPYTVEEAYEVADAVERGDADDLREELGDLLLQVVYHARMAEEAGLFSFGDVVAAITGKMIRRHPHVFGDAEALSAASAKGQWERIKREERAERSRLGSSRVPLPADAGTMHANKGPSLLDNVPAGFPALTLALKVQRKAQTVGFDWDRPEPIHAKIVEEIEEFREAAAANDRSASEAELGDLLFSVVNLARFHDIDPEAALRCCVLKFRSRFAFVETAILARGSTLQAASLDEMEALWLAAKQAESDGKAALPLAPSADADAAGAAARLTAKFR